MNLAPPIKRVPIGTPDQNRKIHRGPLPAKEWVSILNRRKRLRKIITFSILAILLYMSYTILSEESIDTFWMSAYIVIYAAMAYFLFYSLTGTGIGTWALFKNKDLKDHPSQTMVHPKNDARTAILFPVYHEDVARVAAGMAAVWESLSLAAKDHIHLYDIFLLSDSRKEDYRRLEEKSILLLREKYPEARFFYRLRKTNSNAKIGNITDFCRRWGNDYKYMFTMDADSVVAGDTIHTTLCMMEGNDNLGILQTNPKAILRETVFGRMQQFAGNIFGRAFAASLQATMLGNAIYMGHNAMIRVKPFIDFCILPELSGKAPWGGKPLSHDIVESAMMTANGYEVWFLPELKGSWEEVPANILASLIRERRWMQGNLQHVRFLPNPAIPAAYKEYFINGMFSYISAPLWAVFLVVSSYTVFSFIRQGIIDPDTAEILVINMLVIGLSTLMVFLITRFVAIGMVFNRESASGYGGKTKIVASSVLEFLFSMVYSPIIMMMMSRFMWLWARRKSIMWGVQDRGDEQVPWRDCIKHFGWISATGLVVSYFLYVSIQSIPEQDVGLMVAVSNGYFSPYIILYWMAPILSGLILSPWIVRITSKPVKWFRKNHIFEIPEEVYEPFELKVLRRENIFFQKALE